MSETTSGRTNLGGHLANRLVENGIDHCFAVPGDFNLSLLDQLEANPRLNMIWCCNELNAGYAADGYARKKGASCVVVTYGVGGFSVLNAVTGAYSEDLAVVVVSGGPNTNDFATDHVLHHTTGRTELGEQFRCFSEVTCYQVRIQFLEDAHYHIDYAIRQSLIHSKPVYIEVCCNLPTLHHPSFVEVPCYVPEIYNNPKSVATATSGTLEALEAAKRPVLLAGPLLRRNKRREAFLSLAEKIGCPVVVLPDAKGFFPEQHPQFVGTYWGEVSMPQIARTVVEDVADLILAVGPVWTDYSTVGYTLHLPPEKVVQVQPDRVNLCNGKHYGSIDMVQFLTSLAKVAPARGEGLLQYTKLVDEERGKNGAKKGPLQVLLAPGEVPLDVAEEGPLRTHRFFQRVQAFLTPKHSVVTEVGDSWFNSQKLHLPDGCDYEIQMRYGSIGWSVGSVLGCAAALRSSGRRVVALIGDGSFQMTAQEISTMLRYHLTPVIFLINNAGYTIEVEIHDGPYNNIQNWNYTKVVEAFAMRDSRVFTAKASTDRELQVAMSQLANHPDDLCFIEVVVDRHDCSEELRVWGQKVASCNSRKPNPQ